MTSQRQPPRLAILIELDAPVRVISDCQTASDVDQLWQWVEADPPLHATLGVLVAKSKRSPVHPEAK